MISIRLANIFESLKFIHNIKIKKYGSNINSNVSLNHLMKLMMGFNKSLKYSIKLQNLEYFENL